MQTQHLGLDQAGTFARARAGRGLADRVVDGEKVVAVDTHTGETVSGGPLRHARAGHLEGLRHGDRPVVVLAEEDHRAMVDGGEVETFVEVALAGGALPEAHVAERSLPSPFQGQPDAGGSGDRPCSIR